MSLQPIQDPRRAVAKQRRELARLQDATELRLARVQAAAIVQAAKMQAIDSVAREAITGHVVLSRYASAAAAGDPILTDELRIYTTAAQLGKAEMLAHLVETYCREGGFR